MLFATLIALLLAHLTAALGIPNVLTFTPSDGALTLASAAASSALPILYDSGDPDAVHIAVRTFAEDVFRVTGTKPQIYADALPDGTASAIIAATVGSTLVKRIRKKRSGTERVQAVLQSADPLAALDDQWEAFDARVIEEPLEGLKEALLVAGSDRVRVRQRHS